MNKLLLTALTGLLITTGCTSEAAPSEPTTPPAKTTPPPSEQPAPAEQAKAVVHDVMCGCSIDGIGKCDNYIKIDGKYVPLIHQSLGKMEFCAQKDKGAKIETVGAMKDGSFVAESWKLVE